VRQGGVTESARSKAACLVAVVAALAACDAAIADDEMPQPRSIWDGVFTEAQAKRGQAAYTGPCNRCHGSKLDGAQDEPDMLPSPPVAGAKFLRRRDGQPLAVLFEYTRATMPSNNPGFLTDQEVVDILAYMLLVSGAPAGLEELRPDSQALLGITVRARDGLF
jgi:quinoprotein glucose dehydrogenase